MAWSVLSLRQLPFSGLSVLILIFSFSSTATASVGNIATSYGLLPSDVASAQALSLFNPLVSATYYNPAYLAHDSRGELTGGLLHAEQELRADSQGGNAFAPERDGDVLQDAPSSHVLIGLKTDLSSLTTFKHPLYLGFMAGVEKYGQELMAFNSKTSSEGQYLRYGQQPLFLNVGVGTKVWRGINAGLSMRVTLHSEATLTTESTVGGETSFEDLDVSAEPSMSVIAGLSMNVGETFCSVQDCWLDNLDTAFSWRSRSSSRTRVNSDVTIPGMVQGLDLGISTLDSWVPDIYAFGVQYQLGRYRIGATAEMQAWSQLEDALKRDTIKDQAELEFKDILVPRLGMEVRINDMLSLTTGIAYEESPLESERSLDVNYFDNDRIVIGLGSSLQLDSFPFLAHPIRLDFGYQYHQLKSRDFELTDSDSGGADSPYETVTAEGDVHVFNGSVTFKF